MSSCPIWHQLQATKFITVSPWARIGMIWVEKSLKFFPSIKLDNYKYNIPFLWLNRYSKATMIAEQKIFFHDY